MTDDFRSTIRAFILEHARGAELDDDQDIFATGGVSSLFAVQLVIWIERSFGISVEAADLNIANFRTIRDVIGFVEARSGKSTTGSQH